MRHDTPNDAFVLFFAQCLFANFIICTYLCAEKSW